MHLGIILAVSFIVSISARTTPQSCSVSIDTDLAAPQPLYFYHNTTEFVTITDGTNRFDLDAKKKIDLFCTSGFRPPYDTKFLTATCISGTQFKIDDKSVTLSDAACTKLPFHSTRLSKAKCDFGNMVEIGFNVKGSWVPLMELCHDNKTASTKWVHHVMKPSNVFHQRNFPRIFFIKGSFYDGIDVDYLYKKPTQQKTIGKILGSNELGQQIISGGEYYLARGHMAAKADFVFGAHQLATFYYINSAPQWQTFNNGNWLQIEIGIKYYIAKRNIDTDIYTGTHGIATLPDVHGKEQEIYLALNEKLGAHQMPVPRFYYKIIIAESIQAGIVFIGVNNPYVSANVIKSEYILCPDIGDEVTYLRWNRKNLTSGYSYACSVNDFTKVVKHLPKLPKVTHLLL